jgi:predicted RNA-binding Zn ribbon-like protein
VTLIGGAPCLNFANTSSGRGTPLLQEHLRSYDLLLAWSEHAGVLSRAERQRLARLAARRPRAAALVLRRGWPRAGRAHDASPPAPELAVINRELAAAMAQACLRPAEGGFALDWAATPAALDSVLRPLVRSAATLLLGPQHDRVKQCPGHGCGWLFLDLTKNRNRRWCEMEICGSRNKVRRYRERQRRKLEEKMTTDEHR